MLSLPTHLPTPFSAEDLESIRKDIDKLYTTSKFPIERVFNKFSGYDRFNVQQVLPYCPAKWRAKYPDVVLIGVIDRVGSESVELSA